MRLIHLAFRLMRFLSASSLLSSQCSRPFVPLTVSARLSSVLCVLLCTSFRLVGIPRSYNGRRRRTRDFAHLRSSVLRSETKSREHRQRTTTDAHQRFMYRLLLMLLLLLLILLMMLMMLMLILLMHPRVKDEVGSSGDVVDIRPPGDNTITAVDQQSYMRNSMNNTSIINADNSKANGCSLTAFLSSPVSWF